MSRKPKFRVVMSPEFQRQLESLPPEAQDQIRAAVAKLAENPYVGMRMGFVDDPLLVRPILLLGMLFLMPVSWLLVELAAALERKAERTYWNAIYRVRKNLEEVMGCAYYRR